MSDRIRSLYERHATALTATGTGRCSRGPGSIGSFELVGDRGTVLDLGCGMGEPMARYLIEAGYSVVGVRQFDGVLAWELLSPDHGRPAGDVSAFCVTRESGFDVVTYKEEDPDCGGRWIWLARKA